MLEQIRTAVAAGRVSLGETELSFTVSIGMAAMLETRVSVDELLSAADAACYRAKTLGRNRIEVQSREEARPAEAARTQ